MHRICVFAGSSDGRRPDYREAATDLGRALAGSGLDVVYGGAHVGLMGAVADAALAAGGRVIGVIPTALVDKEIAHTGLTELRVVSSMHERKALMADLSDGFVALPGGMGTWEELFEVLTWAQLGLHTKPCALLNVAGYFDPVLALLDHATREGFVRRQHAEMLLCAPDSYDALRQLRAYRPPVVEKWIAPGER